MGAVIASKLVMFLLGILVLGIVVFIHELGHFLLAKWNGIGVIEFSIGFGRKIWRKRVGNTFYSIGLIPLGGYVRMVGDDPRAIEPTVAAEVPAAAASVFEGGAPLEELNQELLKDRSCWFLNKGYWAKMAVVVAGPGFNLLSALLFSVALIWFYGKAEPVTAPVIGTIVPKNPAEQAGLKPKDRVRSVDGTVMESWEALARFIGDSGGREMEFVIERAEEGTAPKELTIKVAGVLEDAELALLTGDGKKLNYRIGIVGDVARVPVSFGEAVVLGSRSIWNLSAMVLKSLKLMITGAVSTKNIAGPIFIFGEAGKSAQQGIERLGTFVIFLSVTLAIMNLLPIPVLDGGHVVFFTIEALKGGPLSVRVQELANQVGLFVLLALMVFAVGNDIIRLF